MSRIQKKCLIVSGGVHGFLLFVILVGAAFFVPEKPEPPVTQPLKMIPSQIIDAALSGGGGDPEVPKTEEKQKGDTFKPQPKPEPEPEPKKEEPKKEEPKKVEPKKAEPKKEEPKKAEPKKEVVKVEAKPEARSRLTELTKKAPVRVSKPVENELAKALEKQAESLAAGFAKGTAVQVSGTGGAAYADYASLVKARYDDAWDLGNGVMNPDSVAKVRVTIARSGRVISAALIGSSGDRTLDATVEQALKRVSFIAEFPKGTTDASRTFIIHFDVGGKQSAG